MEGKFGKRKEVKDRYLFFIINIFFENYKYDLFYILVFYFFSYTRECIFLGGIS